jgi:lia operon protein LiaF
MQGRQVFALILIAFGALLLIGTIFNIDTGRLFWPLLLVIAGLVLILRPQAVFSPGVKYQAIGETDRYGEWDAVDEDIRVFVGDVNLDYEDAHLPDGETRLRVRAFVSDVDLRIPEEVGVRLVSAAFVTSANVNGDKRDYVMSEMRYESDNYAAAAKQLNIQINAFVDELSLKHR